MGYDVRITRAPKVWYENEGHHITRDEWLSLVSSDHELRPATRQDVNYSEGLILWSGAKFERWFSWENGNISTKNPNAAMLAKIVALAERLGARVQGDDGETYLPDGRILQADGTYDPDRDWRKSLGG
jgi:hypothetical protein